MNDSELFVFRGVKGRHVTGHSHTCPCRGKFPIQTQIKDTQTWQEGEKGHRRPPRAGMELLPGHRSKWTLLQRKGGK